jgi:3-hydroxyphenylacetate 6-hydroxylase
MCRPYQVVFKPRNEKVLKRELEKAEERLKESEKA